MGRGNITRRGKNSWRLKFDAGGDGAGERKTHYVTIKGKRQDAQRELTKLLAAADAGTLLEPSKVTIAECLRDWLGTGDERDEPSVRDGSHELSPKTVERYRELAEQQVIPHLGSEQIQQLRSKRLQDWHKDLLRSGGRGGRPLSARTVGHAHRVLHRALQRAVEDEVLARNVASVKGPPSIEEQEVEILTEDQINTVINKLLGHQLHDIVVVDLATGLRRGELLALRLADIDLDGAKLRVERSLEETKSGLRFKDPKTVQSRRTISLPPDAVAVLRERRRKLLEMRMAMGLGKPDGDMLLFGEPDGSPTPPNRLTRRWQDACVSLGLPRVSFHALRHTHASALIAAGKDVVMISRRLGHRNPTVTLNIYSHLFKRDDSEAAEAMQAVFRRGGTTAPGREK
jgi:integrase